MENFIFQPQTKIFFGKKTELSVGREIRRHAGKTLLHYSDGSANVPVCMTGSWPPDRSAAGPTSRW